MKTFLIAALTADGFIAKNDNHPAFWTSKEDKHRFVELTKRAGVVIMGRKTFQTLPRPLAERVNIVYSRSGNLQGAETTSDEPVEILRKLAARGFKEVAICGGSEIYTMFMKANVVDRLYLTIEPLVFGSGIKLFNQEMLQHLKLISLEKTPDGSIMVEYQVDHAGTAKREIEEG